MYRGRTLSYLCIGQDGIDVVVGHDDGDDLKLRNVSRKTRWIGLEGCQGYIPHMVTCAKILAFLSLTDAWRDRRIGKKPWVGGFAAPREAHGGRRP